MAALPSVFPGDPPPRSSAATINAIHATAREANGVVKRDAFREPRSLPLDQNNQILVRNEQPYAVDIENLFAIVSLGESIFDPAAGPAELSAFLFTPCLDVTWPALAGAQSTWGVLLSPLAHGSVGDAVVAGSCVARVSTDCQPGDTVGISSDDGDQTRDILVPVSGGSASVVSLSPLTEPDADYAHPYKWAVIKFGGGGGGGGAELVHFQVLSVCPGSQTSGSCSCVFAVVTRVLCVSAIRVGDLIVVWDFGRCWFNIPLDLLVDRKGTAMLMETGTHDLGTTNCTGYGGARPGDCFWSVEYLHCCIEEVYATI